MEQLSCASCGKVVYRYKSQIANKAFCFCCRSCIRTFYNKYSIVGKRHHLWKGDNVTYAPLHKWVRLHKPKPLLCQRCGIKKLLEVANISGSYKRDVDDYIWICRKCHLQSDGRLSRLIKGNLERARR